MSHTAADAADAKLAWKEYSELAFSNGASLAHKFSKGPKGATAADLAQGLPVVGHEAMQEMLKE
eukprot:989718-Pyramimonas_sp.AAC.1